MFDIPGGCRSSGFHYGRMNLINGLRKLWTEYVIWSKWFLISAVAESEALKQIEKRMLRNPSDFSDLLEIYYGNKKAEIFQRLLADHLKIGVSVIASRKADHDKAAEQYEAKWHGNAAEIALFFSEINPYCNKEEWKNMLSGHIKIMTDEIEASLAGEYTKEILLFDMMETQALLLADAMADGMIKQFKI